MERFGEFWLSRAAFLAAAVFAYSGVRVLLLDPRGLANRLAAAFNAVFVVWALGAVAWFAAPSREAAQALYRGLGWTWCLFPALVLHFDLVVAGRFVRPSRGARDLGRRGLALLSIYAPAALLAILMPDRILGEPIWRAGYWMLGTRLGAPYLAFVAYYAGYVLAGALAVLRASGRAPTEADRARLRLIGRSSLLALALGFTTDTVFLRMGLDVPNLAIFWILILSLGMLAAMRRYDFLAPFPYAEAPRIMDAVADIVIYLDESGRLSWANASALAALGLPGLREARGLGPAAFLPEAEAAAAAALAVGEGGGPFQSRCALGPGALPVELRARAVEALGRPRGAALTAMDLSAVAARESAEGALADTGLLFGEFVARSRDGIVLIDGESRVALWNPALAAMTGLSAEEALGREVEELRARLGIDEAPGTGAEPGTLAPGGEGSFGERTIRRADGARRILSASRFEVALRGGRMEAAVVRDVTEERRRECEELEKVRALERAQKLEAVGTLAGGIAHDFNNTLAGLVGALSLARHGIAAGLYARPEDLSRELELMDRAAARAGSSVRRLLDLTRKRPREDEPLRVDECLRRVADLARRTLDASVRLELPERLPEAHARGDSGQVEQLVLNLLINAEQAMTEDGGGSRGPGGRGGRIRVGLRSARREEADYWLVEVEDEGPGIPPEIAARVFEPFFTTKRPESSTGLGLAMVASIAEQHGGFVELDPGPGRGARFEVWLPAAPPPAATGQGSRPAPLSRRGSGRILLADDDPVPREATEAMLRALGYEPSPCASGEEALERFRKAPESWAAALLDRRMGGMSGDEAGAAMRELRPGFPLVLASGYAFADLPPGSDQGPAEAEGRGGPECLPKPYGLEELAAAMERALGRGR